MSDQLLEERRDSVLTITLNRPEKLNSLSPEMLLRLGDMLNELAAAGEIRAVVIRGAGDKAFSSGYDIGRIPEGAAQAQGPRRPDGHPQTGARLGPSGSNPLQYGLDAVTNFPYPVIASIHGLALGAGLHLALSCDLRIAAPEARLAMPPVKLGVVYPAEGYELFVRLLGPATAKAIFLTGRRFSAEEALRLGIVSHVEPAETLEAYVSELAREIAEENAPLAVRGAKFIINRLAAGPLSAEDKAEAFKLMAQAFQSQDAREARAAFTEKRKPQFTGR